MCPAGEERAGFGCSCWLSGETGVNGPSGFSQQSNGKMQVELGDNSDSMVCRTMENTYGSYHRSLAQGTAKFHINPHSPSNPPPPTHTQTHPSLSHSLTQLLWLYLHLPNAWNTGLPGHKSE